MKIMVLGLGSFGSSLAVLMEEMGHEVIAIDFDEAKTEELKNRVTHTITMNTTNLHALKSLPLEETDIAVVAIGENEGDAILTTANLRTLGIKRIISRSISSTHEVVLEAMGITEILHPEQDAAEKLAKKLNLKLAVESYEMDSNYSIVELKTPGSFDGKTVQEIDLRKNYALNIVTIIRKKDKKNLLGVKRSVYISEGVVGPDTVLNKDDIIVVFGSNSNIDKFCKENLKDADN